MFQSKCKQLNTQYNTQKRDFIIITAPSFLLSCLSLAGSITVYTPNQCKNREKNFNHKIYKGKMPTFAGNKHLSLHFFLHGPRFFHLSTVKVRDRSVGIEHQSGYSRADTKNNNKNKKLKKFPSGENTKIHWRK